MNPQPTPIPKPLSITELSDFWTLAGEIFKEIRLVSTPSFW